MKLNPIVCTLAVAFGGLAMLAQPAFAQAQTGTQSLERVEITGSRIKRVDTEGVAPVITIRREEIERSGASTVEDLVKKLPVLNAGSFGDALGAGNSFSPGTSAASLRGLGVNTTLVLVDGRRVPNYGFAQNITDSFVNLNAIPISAIERIEILKDGAAAIYGSDAIAGVINVILRKDYQAGEASVYGGKATSGGAEEYRATATVGFGSPAKDKFNVMITADYFKRETLLGAERSFTRTADRTADGGFDFRSPTSSPGTWRTGSIVGGNIPDNVVFPQCAAGDRIVGADGFATCAYDFSPFTSIVPGNERKSLVARGSYEFSPALNLSASLSHNVGRYFTQSAPTPGGFNLPVGHNSHPGTGTNRQYFSQFTAAEQNTIFTSTSAIRYRFLDVGPRQNDGESTTTNFTLVAKGSVGGWDYETGYTKGVNKVVSTGYNYISATALAQLVTDGRYNFLTPGAANQPVIAALGLSVNPVRNGESKLDQFDARLSRELFAMAGGSAAVAFGIDWRKESLSDVPDVLSQQGLIVGSGGTVSNGSRTGKAVWAEVSLPLIKNLETQIAVRHETYNTVAASSTVPKLAVSYKPTNQILVRGGYGQGFRAPSLVEQFLGDSTSFPGVTDVIRCGAYRTAFGATDSRTVAVCRAPQVQSTLRGNLALEPEKSKNVFLGIAVDLTNDLSFGLDYYKIQHTNKIDVPLNSDILRNFPQNVRRNPANANDILANTVGSLRGIGGDTVSGIIRQPQNFSSQETSGVDLDVKYRLRTAGAGTFDFTWRSTYMASFRRQALVGGPLEDYEGTYDYPTWRTTLGVNWKRGAWDTTVNVSHVNSYDQFYQAVWDKVPAETRVDLQVQYSGIRNVKIAVGARNLFGKNPAFSDEDYQGYNTATSDPIGRFVYIKGTYTFK